MSSLPYDIVLLPAEELADKAISASKRLEELGTLLTLEDGKCYPHLSVYMLQLEDKNIEKVKDALSKIADNVRAQELEALHFYRTRQYFDIEYSKITSLAELQGSIVDALNPLRNDMRAKDIARMKESVGVARDNYEKYGWKSVGELYRPHMTLTRFTKEQSKAEDLLPGIADFSGDFTRIGLFEMGDNGTSVKKIAEYDLGGDA